MTGGFRWSVLKSYDELAYLNKQVHVLYTHYNDDDVFVKKCLSTPTTAGYSVMAVWHSVSLNSQCTCSLNQQFAVLVHVLYVACKVIALFEERRVVNCFHVTL